MSDENKKIDFPPGTTPHAPVVVSRERFDTIPARRQRYIFLYLAMMAMWVATTVVGVRMQARIEEAAALETAAEEAVVEEMAAEETVAEEQTVTGTEEMTPNVEEEASLKAVDFTETTKTLLGLLPIRYLQVATGACMALFYLNFIGVLRTMGYPVILILVICFGCFFPLPGLLVLAMVDRRVSKVWHDANPEPG